MAGEASLQGIAKINTKYPLVFQAVVSLVFGLSMLVNPLGFLNQYNINIYDMSQKDKMLIATTMQQWGIWMLLIVGLCSIACRVASERTRMHINLAAAVSLFANLLLFLGGGFSAFTSLGCTPGMMVFNLFVTCIVPMILFGLGAGLLFDPAPVKKPIYWGSCVMAVAGLAYSFMFLMFPATLLDSYSVAFDNSYNRTFMLAILQYGWSGFFFQMSVWLLAGMMTTDLMYIYALNRYIAMIQTGMVFVSATNVAWWTTKNAHGELDQFINGQWTNFFMSVVFLLLTYVPMVMLDTKVLQGVKEAIEGQAVSGPTLLSPQSQKKAREGLHAHLVAPGGEA